jgi:DNA-directed RNA polymerase specialized sigma24 family protein
MTDKNLCSSQAGPNGDYASDDDFQRLFAVEMPNLYRLAFFMITDCGKTERCLIAAINDCMSGSAVSRAWVGSWARRVVVRHAIQIVADSQEIQPGLASDSGEALIDGKSQEPPTDAFGEFAAILSLKALERIVFVLCVLERYPIRDCALLLGQSQQNVQEAQSRALEQIAAYQKDGPRGEAIRQLFVKLGSGGNEEPEETNDSCGTLLRTYP